MLFIMVMDVLTTLFEKADALGLLTPLLPERAGGRLHIYADNVVLFSSPSAEDLAFITALLSHFGEASCLKANMAKSTALPIRCDEEQIQMLHSDLECNVSSFLTKYLGLPLALSRLRAVDLQPVLDKLADRLTGWKAALLDKPARLILTKTVLMAIPLHTLLAMDVPKWFIKAIDRIRRNFFWQGRRDTRRGNCPVAWDRVMRPLHLGGPGIQNLTMLGWAMKMHWKWIQKTQPDHPLASIALTVPREAAAMFRISVCSSLGDGASTLFWTDRWVHGKSLEDLAPAVMPFVRRRGWRRRTVRDALNNNAWVQDIVGGLPVVTVDQVLQIIDILADTELSEQPDQHHWMATSSGRFTVKSAYQRYFTGGVKFEHYRRLWK